jgi:ferritin
MLLKKMEKALSGQINAEFYSSYLYMSMSVWFTSQNLTGMAKWMTVQAREEWVHGMKIHDFLLERGGRVTLGAVAAPPADFTSPLAVFQAAYKHEQKVTGLIGDLVDLAKAENDHATGVFLQWFVSEQVEEEANAGRIVAKLEQVKDSPQGLFMMDAVLGKRGGE